MTPDPIKLGSWNLSILKVSDLLTALTRAFNDYVYGRSISIKKAGFAVLVSMISRMLSDNIQPVLGGEYTDQSSKNQIVVAVINAIAGAMWKQNPVRTAMDGVSADLTAEWLMKALGTTFGNPTQTWDISLIPPQTMA